MNESKKALLESIEKRKADGEVGKFGGNEGTTPEG